MCGIFGIFGHVEAANLCYLGLHALQHRGQESAGIVSADGEQLFAHRAMGLVQAGFHDAELEALKGEHAIGHVRYSTAGGSHLKNAQPFAIDYQLGSLAVAHNGNLTNHDELRQRLEERGSIFQSASDTEAILHLIALSRGATLEARIVEALGQVEGAYSLVFLSAQTLVAARDPHGFRPLCLGILRRQPGDDRPPSYVVASEPVAFDLIGAEAIRDIDPGEVVIIDAAGIRSERPFSPRPARRCVFEYVYFARPDSVLDRAHVYQTRRICGRKLWEEHPVFGSSAEDTVVVPVPDSGVPAAIGLADRARLPFEMGLIRSHYVGRTFIEPEQGIRHFGVRLKLNPNAAALRGKRVVVVDDSIVRGTTSRKLVSMLRAAGAREVHLRVSSPPTKWPCYYGIDTPTRDELVAASNSVEQIRERLGADTLGYLSLEGLIDAVREAAGEGVRDVYCHACFSGDYAVPIHPAPDRLPRSLRLV